MTRLASARNLVALRESLTARHEPGRPTIAICGGTGCRAKGSEEVASAFAEELARLGLSAQVTLSSTGCHGFCERGPVVVLRPQGVFYQSVRVEDVPEIVSETLLADRLVERLLYTDPVSGRRVAHERDVPFYRQQQRVVLDLNGLIDPTSILDYIAHGGYAALARTLCELTPEQVIAEVTAAGLRGRGGAGFPTGQKWRLCREASGQPKYIVCNADEGDPGAYMDRSLMEGNPHRVLEGMIIGAYAIGASRGFVYIRNEYPLAVRHLSHAIEQATAYGLLGDDILGTGFRFSIEVRLGGGAFVCGEETALMASIEGRPGEPRPRPPFPAQSGLWGKPTNINNVETWANVPLIVSRGAAWFRSLGTEASGGTKIFSLVGKVNNTGLVEVPIGTSLGEIVFDIGGGIRGGKAFKAAQLGGPSGGCIPGEHLNVPVDYDTLKSLGAIMGSGGLVVCDEDTCMVDLARFFVKFTQEESCGKCLPCRIGTRAMLDTLERICAGRGREGDIEYLEELGEEIKRSALCGLGQTAPNPVLTSIRYFRSEYEAHIRDRRCPAGVCEALVRAPCQNACPAEMDVPGYVSLVGEGRFEEALALMLETNPFPSVCGRVCNHPCEAKCRRAQLDEPVAIRQLKRFVAGQGLRWPIAPVPKRDGPRVAIIGAGPAGLTCAFFLARLGYRPTVFEKLPVAGGMLAVGIPEYRLPKAVLREEIERIAALGVEIRTNTPIGDGLRPADLLREGYRALFVATGAHRSRHLAVPGESLPGVIPATDLLRAVSLGEPLPAVAGARVAVIGGGNAAVDAARTVLRLGAREVTILYRRSRADMPALAEEIEAALAEGVSIQELTNPVAIFGEDGNVRAIECQRMRPGPFDRTGRRQPVPDSEARFTLATDLVIAAIGQGPDSSPLLADLGVRHHLDGTIEADADGRTSVPGVFAGGDAVTGPATVIEAIASGRRAAIAIHRYLQGDRASLWEPPRPAPAAFDPEAEPVPYGRCRAGELPAAERCRSFAEVEAALDAETARCEARRCLRCDFRGRE